ERAGGAAAGVSRGSAGADRAICEGVREGVGAAENGSLRGIARNQSSWAVGSMWRTHSCVALRGAAAGRMGFPGRAPSGAPKTTLKAVARHTLPRSSISRQIVLVRPPKILFGTPPSFPLAVRPRNHSRQIFTQD